MGNEEDIEDREIILTTPPSAKGDTIKTKHNFSHKVYGKNRQDRCYTTSTVF